MSRIVVKNATRGKELIWRRVVVRKSLDDICHTLECEIAPSERLKVSKHDKIEVRYQNPLVRDSQEEGGRRVTTVLVDDITADVDAQKHGITVVGRSPARDIIDSSWSADYNDMTLRELTRAIGEKFNITCDVYPTDKPDPTKTVSAFRLENESPWTKLIGEADNQGYVFTSNEAGNLYLWPVPALSGAQWHFHLTEGINIKNISWKENGSEQYHEYIVTGGGNTITVPDPTCRAGRVRTIDITKPDISETELQRRGETEMRRRRENRTTVNVAGWGLTDEQIKRLGATDKKEIFFVPNLLTPVRCPSIGLDAKLLISEVEYEATPETHGANITVVNKEAYQ
jgi:prophage tail gpP-like protein